ncbi:MAG: metallophosphoesterase family protein, partial [Candidatus Hodarchaeales archaeon]
MRGLNKYYKEYKKEINLISAFGIILVIMSLIMMIFTPFSAISVGNIQTSEKTQGSTNEFVPYYFISFGDTRSNKEGGFDDNSGLEAIAPLMENLIDEYNVSFMLHVGDVVEYGGDQDWWDTYWWPLMGNISDKVQIYYAVGNHEYASETGIYDLDLITFKANVDNPGNELYFSFNSPLNDTHFIVFNSEYRVNPDPNMVFAPNNATLWAEQEDWLVQDLAENTIERVIVMIHRPVFGVNPTKFSDYVVMEELLQDIFIAGGVDQA